jgi:DNA-binding CsgD family transcriptional regulator
MNMAVFDGARRAGLTSREAEVLAVYVESDKMAVVAQKLRISEHTAKNLMSRVYAKLDVAHAAAAVAKVTTA